MRFFILFLLSILFFSCKKDAIIYDGKSGFPDGIEQIINANCSVSGCHNQKSKDASAGLSLETWEDLFLGARGGAVAIPYQSNFSPLCFIVNTFPELGPILKPTMPINLPALSREDYLKIKSWILVGAPNNKGKVKFEDNINRNKFYVINHLCDVVTVIDCETMLAMRYIDVGVKASIEFPSTVKVSPDKKNWYVSFMSSGLFQKFNCDNDAPDGQIDLGAGSWNSFIISNDSKYAFCVKTGSPGEISVVDLSNMTLLSTNTFSGKLDYPNNGTINSQSNIYVCPQQGNFIYKLDYSLINSPVLTSIPVDGSAVIDANYSINPSQIIFDNFSNKYFVLCVGSYNIMVMDAAKDSLLAVLPSGFYPQQACINNQHKLLVTCPEDTLAFPGLIGAVYCYNLTTMTLENKIYTGTEPYGIAFNSKYNAICISNMNIKSGGSEPHHTSNCGGRNGSISFLNADTYQKIRPNYEAAVVPYYVTSR